MTHMRGIEINRETCQKAPPLTDVVYKLNVLYSDHASVFSFSRLHPLSSSITHTHTQYRLGCIGYYGPSDI